MRLEPGVLVLAENNFTTSLTILGFLRFSLFFFFFFFFFSIVIERPVKHLNVYFEHQ